MTTETAETPAATTPATGTPRLNKALSQLQGELPRITKTKTAEVKDQQTNRLLYSYDYADLGDVVADVGPLLAKYGLAFHCGPTINPADRREMILTWALLHESGEEKTGEWPLGPVNQKPQSLGSAITYGRRYSFTAATNIVLEDDDDGQRAQQAHGSRQSAGDAWDSAAPARPRNQGPRRETTTGNAARPPADLGDWGAKIDAITSPEDGDQAQVELDEAFTGGQLDTTKAQAIRRAIKAKVASLADGSQQQGDDQAWVKGFRASLEGLDAAQLGTKRGVVGRAIADRKITPATGAVLSGEIAQLRRELSEASA